MSASPKDNIHTLSTAGSTAGPVYVSTRFSQYLGRHFVWVTASTLASAARSMNTTAQGNRGRSARRILRSAGRSSRRGNDACDVSISRRARSTSVRSSTSSPVRLAAYQSAASASSCLGSSATASAERRAALRRGSRLWSWARASDQETPGLPATAAQARRSISAIHSVSVRRSLAYQARVWPRARSPAPPAGPATVEELLRGAVSWWSPWKILLRYAESEKHDQGDVVDAEFSPHP